MHSFLLVLTIKNFQGFCISEVPMIVGIISTEVFQAGTETSYTLSLLHPFLGINYVGKFNNSTLT